MVLGCLFPFVSRSRHLQGLIRVLLVARLTVQLELHLPRSRPSFVKSLVASTLANICICASRNLRILGRHPRRQLVIARLEALRAAGRSLIPEPSGEKRWPLSGLGTKVRVTSPRIEPPRLLSAITAAFDHANPPCPFSRWQAVRLSEMEGSTL